MRLLTLARDLRRRKARERDALFVVEGVRGVEELLASPLDVVGVLVAPKLSESPRGAALLEAIRTQGRALSEVDEKEFRSAAETESPQGVLAVARVPGRSLDSLKGLTPLRMLVLDAVQDPGNVGTILRTAAALGAHASVALPGTVDVWNAKVVRSAMGAHFRHLAFHTTWDELHAFLGSEPVPLWAADTQGAPPPRDAPARLALAVGNEGSGLSAPVRAAAARLVSVPLAAGVESLNVAVAAGILLYELRP
ncbi:MAG TPA: RNA methyltransferase [Gemmatimonadaceae bacterium]|nr:RNA methyltransferase [Gemmatimonadaceae bacterium]